MQCIMVGYSGFFSTLFRSTPLTFGMHLTAVCLGLGSWVLAALMKLTGKKVLNCMPEFGEDAKALELAKARTDAATSVLQRNEAKTEGEATAEATTDADLDTSRGTSKLDSMTPSSLKSMN